MPTVREVCFAETRPRYVVTGVICGLLDAELRPATHGRQLMNRLTKVIPALRSRVVSVRGLEVARSVMSGIPGVCTKQQNDFCPTCPHAPHIPAISAGNATT